MNASGVVGSALQPDVLVMAGGRGQRLGDITRCTPKPMLLVDGRPLLQHTFEQLMAQGVHHVFVSVGHLAHVVCDYFGDGRWLGIDIEYVREQQPLGTAGAIGLLADHSRSLLVINGDVVTPIPVSDVVSHHEEHEAAITVACTEYRVSIPFGVIESRWPGDVQRLHEKPDVVVKAVAGVYLVAPEVAASVPRNVALDMPDLISRVLLTWRVVAYPLPGPWLDIGTPDDYERADRVVASTQRTVPIVAPRRGPGVVPMAFAGAVSAEEEP